MFFASGKRFSPQRTRRTAAESAEKSTAGFGVMFFASGKRFSPQGARRTAVESAEKSASTAAKKREEHTASFF
jgi:hypothetical protein